MKPERSAASPRAQQLVAADEQATAYGDDTGAVERCPLADSKQPGGQLRIMLWHLSELGGGLRWPERRSATVIDACATVVAKSDSGICAIMGVTRGRRAIKRAALRDGTIAYFTGEEAQHSGTLEVQRIIAALRRIDASGDWQAAFAKRDAAYLHHRGTTACFLYRAASGIALDGVTLVAAEGRELGALVCGAFTVTLHGAPVKLPVLAPLASASAAGEPPEPVLETDGGLPDLCVLAFSLPYARADQPGRLAALRAAVDAEYMALPDAGSMPRAAYWEAAFEQCERLIDNPLTLDPLDVRLHDQAMHWEALRLPDHPDTHDKVVGRLSDLVALRNTAGEPLCARELRVIDLVRAACPDGSAAEPGATPLERDHLLAPAVHQLAAERKPPTGERADDLANRIHAATQLTRLLSAHWPVVVSIASEA